MWTPKRVLLLMVGFGLFFTTYAVYAHFLGGIDGLPPLPKQYFPSEEPLCDISQSRQRASQAERKLAQAFGNDCDEMKRPIKLLLNARGLVLASNVCEPQPDGRVLLKPFSVAIYSKDTGDGRFPEINTVRADVAFISFDRPVHNQTEIAGRKITGGELQGSVTLINNRRTPQRTDDLQVTVSGVHPVYYLEKTHRIWTKGFVKLTDTQTTPNPTTIEGTGMDLFLTPPQPATAPKGPRKQKSDALSGVDRVLLHKYVTMHLYVDGRSGFLSNGLETKSKADPSKPAAAAAPKPPAQGGTSASPTKKGPDADKDHVYIECKGPFNYDLRTDVATFDTLNKGKKKKGNFEDEDQVLVNREHAPGPGQGRLNDQILCDHLSLKFRRKITADPTVAREAKSGDREIETAHATAEEVTLSLDGPQGLEAFGRELIYQSPTATKGSLTILKGTPLEVIKDCNFMRARELWLQASLQKGGPTLTTAMGPGQIDMADRTTDRKVVTPRYPVHITWNDTLVSTKDGAFDLYTLTGGASFIDDDHKQQLHGKRLQVWLVPADAGKSSAAAPATVAAPKQATPSALDPARQRPRRLEAFEHVRCFSPEMNVQEAEHLVVKFKDAPPAKGVLPAALPPAVSAAGVKSGTTAAPLGTGTKLTGSSPDGKPTAGPQAPAKKPMDLWARSVVASVIRYGDKNELQKLLTEGAVHVHQDGSTPQDKGVDITGEILELYRDWENYPNPSRGDLLIVFGDSKNPLRVASLQLGNLTLKGPKVTIDQKENTAEVKGAGTMRMPSNSTLSGKKSAKDSVLDVYWNTGMFFNGKDAEFDGGAIAVQDNSRLQCRTLQVSLDKYVSLKEGQKGGQGAKVEQMVCDKKVNAEEITRLEGKLQKYSKSEGREMTFDNRDERVYVTGPGKVHLLQLGSVDDGAGTAPRPLPTQVAPKAPSRPKEEMKLTRVEYEGNMLTYKVGLDRRTTVFRDHVEVVSAPCPKEDIYMAIDKDKPPERGLYLRCAILTMYTSPDARVKGKNTQTLVAEDHAFVKTPEYQANAWKITFEEASDLVKFEGKDGVPVLFSKLSPKQGADPKQFRGRKILYNRKTRQFKVEDGDSIRLDD